MSKQTSLEERMQIMELAEGGLSDAKIAEKVGWSVWTVRKWRRRGLRAGRSGFARQMGRPSTGALSSFPAVIVDRLYTWRTQYPGWGPSTLRSELERHPQLGRLDLPSRASIGRFLQQAGLTHTYQRHSTLPIATRCRADAPHDLWEMDAQGHGPVAGAGIIAPINLNDAFSRTRLLCYPCQVGFQRWQRHPNTEDYQLALRLAFTDWGLPQQIQVDHASVFYDNNTASPYPTRLHQWLIALGISIHFSDKATDQGITERSHQLWQNQCIQRSVPFRDWSHLYMALRQRRDVLNYSLPCRSTDNLPPLIAHPEAIHSGRTYRPESEAKLLDLHRLYTYLAQGRWFRLVSKDGTLSLGGQVYYVGYSWARHQVELTFHPVDQHFVCLAEDGQTVAHLPIRNLSVESLMGDIVHSFNLPFFQFALPFDWHTIQVTRLFETLWGTT